MEDKYKKLKAEEINVEFFQDFIRRQIVTRCWRLTEQGWVILDAPFIDDWSQEDYRYLSACLINTLNTGGVVFGFFEDGKLKGFASVEGAPLGSRSQYLDLSSLHVSADKRGQGIGRKLFQLAAGWAQEHGAEKLYISGHSAVETQAFYKAMGCVEAAEYNPDHVEKEPFDCQLEFPLSAR